MIMVSGYQILKLINLKWLENNFCSHSIVESLGKILWLSLVNHSNNNLLRELLEANFMGRAMGDSALSNEIISTKLMVLGSCKGKTIVSQYKEFLEH